MLSLPCFETMFLLLTPCNVIAHYITTMLSMLLILNLLLMLNNNGAL